LVDKEGAQSRQSLLEFPCDFPIKIMGARVDGFAQAVLEVVLRHAPDFDPAGAEMRPSSKGNYLAVTCTFRAVSQLQVDTMYRELTSHPMGKVVR
jgi:putative lipoic acid-binding regulatory protein